MYVHIYIIQKKTLLFFEVLVQMEMILRHTKNHPVPVKAKNSGIERAYLMFWDFFNYYFFCFCNHQEGKVCLVLDWLQRHTHSERK